MWVAIQVAGSWLFTYAEKGSLISIGNGFINFDFWCNVALGMIA